MSLPIRRVLHTWGMDFLVEEITATSITLNSSHVAKVLWFTSNDPITVVIPSNAADPLNVGFNCLCVQGGTGVITFIIVGSETILSTSTLYETDGVGSIANLVKTATQTWWLSIPVSGVSEAQMEAYVDNAILAHEQDPNAHDVYGPVYKTPVALSADHTVVAENHDNSLICDTADVIITLPAGMTVGHRTAIFRKGTFKVAIRGDVGQQLLGDSGDLDYEISDQGTWASVQLISENVWSIVGNIDEEVVV